MAVNIVSEITEELKLRIEALLTEFKRLPYEHDIFKNNERELTKRFGVIPTSASFLEGRSLGFVVMEHTFQLILTNDYLNQDCDERQSNALHELYEHAHEILKDLQKSSLTLPTSGYNVVLINGLSFEEPAHFDENSVVVLRVNFNVQYRFRRN